MRRPSGEKRGVEAMPGIVATVRTAIAAGAPSAIRNVTPSLSRARNASAPSVEKVSPE